MTPEVETRGGIVTTRTYRLFGIPVFSITTDEATDDDQGSATTEMYEFGFVRSDLPNWHRTEEADE